MIDNPENLDGFIVARKEGTLHCVAVDREDYGLVVAAGPWRVQPRGRTFRAQRDIRRPDGRRMTEYLHRFVMGLTPGDKREVDHRDGNALNNTRANLRIVTRKENNENRASRPGSSSKYRGVSWHSRDKKWRAKVQHNGVTHHLGYFTSEAEAAHAASEGRARLFTHHNETRHPVA